jgi:hypothetical protein
MFANALFLSINFFYKNKKQFLKKIEKDWKRLEKIDFFYRNGIILSFLSKK